MSIWPATLEGVVIMTATTEPLGLLDQEALERTPELIKELRDALRYGKPVTVSHTEIVVEPLQGLDDRRYPVWGEPNSWHLCQEILGEEDVNGERMVRVGPSHYSKVVMYA